MNRLQKALWHSMGSAVLLAAVLCGGCAHPNQKNAQTRHDADATPVKLYCGGGVRGPVSECLAEFEGQTGIKVEAIFGPSGRMFEEACRQHDGVYLAGDIQYIQETEQQGLSVARRTVCHVVPVLAVPRGNPKRILQVGDLGKPGVRFYLVDAKHCQQGIMGERLLARQGVTAQALAANRVAELPEGQTIAGLLSAGKLAAAIIWEHDAMEMGDGVEILRPPELVAATCPVAVVILRGCRAPTAAERLIEFLVSPAAGKIFTRHGFSLQPPEAHSAPALAAPDYNKFGEAEATRFNRTAKARPIIYTRMADYLIARLDLSLRPGVGIDIGGGPGDLILELAGRTKEFYWINADINTWYARPFAQDACARGLAQRTSFAFADACALPFRDQYADIVISRGAYQFWSSLEDGVREIHRVLKPGGWAFIGRGFPPTMPEKEVRDLLKSGVAGGPKYDPDKDAARFHCIMQELGVKEYEVIRHKPKDPSLSYGVWLCFRG